MPINAKITPRQLSHTSVTRTKDLHSTDVYSTTAVLK